MDMNFFLIAGVAFLGIGLLGLGISVIRQSTRKEKALARIEEYVSQRRRVQGSINTRNQASTTALTGKIDSIGAAFSKTKAFALFIDEDDRKLLGKAGFGTEENLSRYVLLRVTLAGLGFAFGFYMNLNSVSGTTELVRLVALGGAGFMLPKWILKMISEGREQAFERELVAIVDVMRLLQGVGLSVDQSIEIIATQLRDLVPITGKLLHKARVQVKSGVPWATVLKKIGEVYASDEFKSFVQVLGQIEKFGGAVQEPLRQFSDRLVERERSSAKELMGKLTVKLTGVMVITMLPALLIVAGGPGVISIMQAFSRVG